ncbi:hypothetical protein M5K25_015288 [Dendrobium thyrsiflorum]|uniref:Uncharacterized protein n=1 Tax=Dendrobium thyrsiflorum TaxID=117978 RepID=A0ABD0UPU8_DENTH
MKFVVFFKCLIWIQFITWPSFDINMCILLGVSPFSEFGCSSPDKSIDATLWDSGCLMEKMFPSMIRFLEDEVVHYPELDAVTDDILDLHVNQIIAESDWDINKRFIILSHRVNAIRENTKMRWSIQSNIHVTTLNRHKPIHRANNFTDPRFKRNKIINDRNFIIRSTNIRIKSEKGTNNHIGHARDKPLNNALPGFTRRTHSQSNRQQQGCLHNQISNHRVTNHGRRHADAKEEEDEAPDVENGWRKAARAKS